MESAVSYLKEESNLRYAEIARQLNRDDRTVWTVYKRAQSKRASQDTKEQSIKETQLSKLPVDIFRDRTLSFMESAVEYMKNTLGFSYAEIARRLNRDDRTVWTVYQRAKSKRGDQE